MLRSFKLPTIVGILGAVLVAGCGGGSSGPTRPVIGSATPPAGMTGVSYAGFTFAVASGGVAPFTWSETGALPAGMSFSASGQLTGIPATAATYHITVTVVDSSTPALSATPVAVSLVIQDSPIVVASTPAPPAGARGNAYPRFTFSASGGSPSFTWAITAGALPDGLTLAINGVLSGTPTRNATYQFTATATDRATPPGSGSAQFTITVSNPPPPAIVQTPLPTGTVGLVYPPFQLVAIAGLPPLVWSEAESIPGFTLSSSGVLSGTPTTAGQFRMTVSARDALNQPATDVPFTVRVSLARPAAAFMPTGSMRIARYRHSAALLKDGKVLVTGGMVAVPGGPDAPAATAELYDPVTGAFTDAAGSMTTARAGHTATLLNTSGSVLIAGGSAVGGAELYNPATGTFAATGSLITARLTSTATLLESGKVLVAGGSTAAAAAIAGAELYDPATGTFTSTKGAMTSPRAGHTATLLSTGKVLIAGGITGPGSPPTATAELYDPATDTFTATTNMTVARTGHTATLLQDGSVLMVGTDGTPIQVTADLYEPGTGIFTAVGTLQAGGARIASLRSDGTVVVAGGVVTGETRGPDGFGGCKNLFFPLSVASAELFAPESAGFTDTGSLGEPRDEHTATVLADGTVLVIGGLQHSIIGSSAPNNCTGAGAVAALSSAELFK